jgi:hypothetical protein
LISSLHGHTDKQMIPHNYKDKTIVFWIYWRQLGTFRFLCYGIWRDLRRCQKTKFLNAAADNNYYLFWNMMRTMK